jgi:hypothetical protein
MTDFLNVVMLVAASAGALAFGVLAAYGMFHVGFALMRPRGREAVVKSQPQSQPEAAQVL